MQRHRPPCRATVQTVPTDCLFRASLDGIGNEACKKPPPWSPRNETECHAEVWASGTGLESRLELANNRTGFVIRVARRQRCHALYLCRAVRSGLLATFTCTYLTYLTCAARRSDQHLVHGPASRGIICTAPECTPEAASTRLSKLEQA